jgi:hypothetical protein
VRQIAIDQIGGPGGRPDRCVLRVDPGDAGNQPVGPGQVEARVEPQRHRRGGRFGGADAGDHAQHLRPGVVEQVVVRLREGNPLVERQPFAPQLELAGRIAGVLADLEHGDDHHPHRQRRGARRARLAFAGPGRGPGDRRRRIGLRVGRRDRRQRRQRDVQQRRAPPPRAEEEAGGGKEGVHERACQKL